MRRTYAQFCPIARALDQLGERWTLLIIRELLVGPQRYSDLRDHLPGMWSNLLAQRLRDLEAAGLVQRRMLPRPAARLVYELTDRGAALEPTFYELSRWGLDLLADPGSDVVPLHLLPLGLKGMLRTEALPDRALVVAWGLDEGSWTMRVAAPHPETRPLERVTVVEGVAADADVTVHGSVLTLLGLRRGDTTADATHGGELDLDGDADSLRAVEAMLGLVALGV